MNEMYFHNVFTLKNFFINAIILLQGEEQPKMRCFFQIEATTG